jgi:adenylate cyclase
VPLIAVVIVVIGLCTLLSLPVGYNLIGPWRDRRMLRKSDGAFLEHYCRHGSLIRYHRLNRWLPANPRCKLCYVPFGGVGRVLGVRPSRKNSNFCRSCFEAAPLGGEETEVGVLFADARGFTAWATTANPTVVAEALSRFYKGATTSLMAHDAIIDKFVGDEVMAIFIADIPTLRDRMCDQMLLAANELLAASAASFKELPVGVGLHCGTAWVGNVGGEDMKDFTALGDVVNLAARLQGCAGPGQIVMSDDVQSRLSAPPATTAQMFAIKGKDEAVLAHVAEPLTAAVHEGATPSGR